MKFKIYGIDASGSEDSLLIEGETLEELKAMAVQEVEKRGWSDCWSEECDD